MPIDEATFLILEQRQIAAYISLGREGKPSLPGDALSASQRMAESLKTETGSERYARRKAIVEPVFGWVKNILGFRRFSFRGEVKARQEWRFLALAVNLKRLHALSLAL